MEIKDIDESMSVESLIEHFPASTGYLTKEGVVCFLCGEPAWGTLGEIITSKGLDVKKVIDGLKAFLIDLNRQY